MYSFITEGFIDSRYSVEFITESFVRQKGILSRETKKLSKTTEEKTTDKIV